MHITKLFALTALLAATAFAAPAAEADASKPKPSKPQKPPQQQQTNSCGNGVAPYCCNTDNSGKYTSCAAMGESSQTLSPSFHTNDSVSAGGAVRQFPLPRSFQHSSFKFQVRRLTYLANRWWISVLSYHGLLQRARREFPCPPPFQALTRPLFCFSSVF